jgi:hypothetical protein
MVRGRNLHGHADMQNQTQWATSKVTRTTELKMRNTRRLIKHGYIVLIIAGIAACSSDPAKHAANDEAMKSDPSKGLICTNDTPTGSMLRTKKCTTPEQRANEQREADHQMVIQPGPR